MLTFIKGLNNQPTQQRLKAKIEENEKVRASEAPGNANAKLTLDEICEMAIALEKLNTETSLTNQQCLKIDTGTTNDKVLAVEQRSTKQKSGLRRHQQNSAVTSLNRMNCLPINNFHFCGDLHCHCDCLG